MLVVCMQMVRVVCCVSCASEIVPSVLAFCGVVVWWGSGIVRYNRSNVQKQQKSHMVIGATGVTMSRANGIVHVGFLTIMQLHKQNSRGFSV